MFDHLAPIERIYSSPPWRRVHRRSAHSTTQARRHESNMGSWDLISPHHRLSTRERDERCTSVPLRLEAGVNLPAPHADTSFAGADRVGPRHRGGCDTGVATLGCLIASERLVKLVAIGAENQRPSVRQLLSSRADINHGTDLKEWCRRRNDYTCTY